MNCYICNTKMKSKNKTIETGWGNYKTEIENVELLECPKCKETILNPDVSEKLQKIAKVKSEKENRNNIFTITCFEDIDSKWGTKGSSRCFGYYNTFKDADEAVRQNCCDIHEYLYEYAVIEEVEPGIHPINLNRWFYKYNSKTREFEKIDEPEEVGFLVNFSIG